MALRRRGHNQTNIGIWPGFVDALTAMLLVITFLMSIFMITQYFLRETIEGQEAELTDRDSRSRSKKMRGLRPRVPRPSWSLSLMPRGCLWPAPPKRVIWSAKQRQRRQQNARRLRP